MNMSETNTSVELFRNVKSLVVFTHSDISPCTCRNLLLTSVGLSHKTWFRLMSCLFEVK